MTYEVHVSTTPGFTPNAGTLQQSTPATSAIIRTTAGGTPLAPGTTYYVKLIAKDGDGAAAPGAQGSGVITVIAVSDGVPPSSSPTPTIVSGVGFLTARWAAAPGTTDLVSYEVHISTTTGFTPSAGTLQQIVTGTAATIRTDAAGVALAAATTYYIKLIARDVDGAAAAGAQGSGTIIVIAPPTDGSAPGSSPTPTLTPGVGFLEADWAAVANADPVTYEVHLSSSTGFTPNAGTLALTTPATSTVIRTAPAGGALVAGTTYYCKLVARDADGSAAAGAQSGGASILVIAPPTDGAPPSASPTPTVTPGVGTLTARWPAQANADPVTYEVHVSVTTGFTPNAGTLQQSTPATSAVIRTTSGGTALAPGTTYFVKLIAKDADGAAAAGAQASGAILTIASDGSPPSSSPTPTLTSGIGFLSARWAAAGGTTDLIIYEVHLSAVGAGFTPSAATKVGETAGLGYTIRTDGAGAALVYGTTYFCKLIARDFDGAAAASAASAGVAVSAITSGDIPPGTIVGADLVPDTITGTEIGPNAVSTPELNANAVTAAKIAANTITAGQIAADTITAAEIAANAIGTNELNANAVTAAKIAAGTITSNEIAANTITAADIAADTITAAEIAANAITATELAAGAVIAGKIAAGTITSVEIAANTITAADIAANTITAAEIATGAITADELAAGSVIAGKIAAGSITSVEIAANTITAADIAANTITAAEIAAGAITASELAAGSVTASAIAAGTITGNEIAANTITAADIAAGTITAAEIAAGAVGADEIAANSITAAHLTVGAVEADALAANSVTADHIVSGAITSEKLDALIVVAGAIQTAEAGRRIELDAGGFRAITQAEEILVNIPTEEGISVSVRAEINAQALTVEAGGTLRGTLNVEPSAVIDLVGNISAPTSKPSVTQYLNAFALDGGLPAYIHGPWYDGTNLWVITGGKGEGLFGKILHKLTWNAGTLTWEEIDQRILELPTGQGQWEVYGIVHILTYWIGLSRRTSDDTQRWLVWDDDALDLPGGLVTNSFFDDGSRDPLLTTDGTSLFVADPIGVDQTNLQTWTPLASGATPILSNEINITSLQGDVRALYYGNAGGQFTASRWVIRWSTSAPGGPFRVYSIAGVRQVNEEWLSPQDCQAWSGLFFDGHFNEIL